MNTFRLRFRLLLALGALFLVTGCDDCRKLNDDLSAARAAVLFQQGVAALAANPTHALPEHGAQPEADVVVEPIKRPRIVLRAKGETALSAVGIPNKSYGKFIAQVTVAPLTRVGLVDGQSAAFLEMRQPRATGGPRRFSLGAVFDATADGLRVIVSDPEGPTQFGTPVTFNGKYEVDLRIQQTDTQLIFSTRETPADQSAGGWTVVHTAALALDASFFHVSIGMRKIGRGGAIGFTHFAIDGDAIGGPAAYPIIAKARESFEAVEAAQAKLRTASPDLAAVAADLDNALTLNEDAATLFTSGGTFENAPIAFVATVGFNRARAAIMGAIQAVEMQNVAKAKAQLAPLDAVRQSQQQAMANLLGWVVPRLRADAELFSLRIP